MEFGREYLLFGTIRSEATTFNHGCISNISSSEREGTSEFLSQKIEIKTFIV
jgi:hypothetical protein